MGSKSETLSFTILMHDQGSKVVSKFAGTVAKAAGDVEKTSGRFASAGKKSGEGLGKALLGGFAGYLTVEAVRAALSGIIGGASDLNETISKTDQVFGKSSGQIHAWAKTAETSMGLSQNAAESNANSLGLLFSQVGFNTDAAASMSKRWVQLAVDLGSFNNANPVDILEAMQSATRGEYDELQRFVPSISAATLEQKALTMTGKQTADMLTDQDKILALQTIAFQQTGKAQGDFARTSGGVANQTKIATAELQNAAAALGGKLLPAAAGVLKTFTGEVIPTVKEAANIFGDLPTPVKAGVTAILGLAGASAIAVPAGRKLVDKVNEIRDAYNALSRIGKLSTLSLGALGVAFTVGAAILGAYAKQQADAKQAVQELTDTLDDQTAGVTASTRLWARDELEKNKAKEAALSLGIQLNDLVTAGLDPTSDAAARVNAILSTYQTTATNAYGVTQQNTAAARDNAAKATLVENALKGQNNQLDEARKKKREDIEVSKGVTDATGDQAAAHETAAQKAKKEADELSNLINQLTKLTRGALDVTSAEIGYQQAIDDATQSAKDNGKNLDINTQKGRDNRRALDGIASATADLIESRAKSGANEQALQRIQDEGTIAFYKQARAMGDTAEEADALTRKYFGIPGSRLTKLVADKKDAEAKIRSVKTQLNDKNLTKTRRAKLEADIKQLIAKKLAAQRAIDTLHGKTVRVNVDTHHRDFYSGGQQDHATGGGSYSGRYASGTMNARPGLALVGENGPEVVQMAGGERVFTAAQTRRMAGGFAPTTGHPLDLGSYKHSGDLHIHLHNEGIIASRQEALNWLSGGIDDLRRQGRLPVARSF